MGSTESGAAAAFEHQILGATGAIGAQTKLAFGVGVTRWIVGALAKHYVADANALWFAEADAVYSAFDAAGIGSTMQLVTLVGASWFPERGAILSLYAEHEQTDLRVRDARWEAGSLQATWFPYAHVELQLLGRLQLPAGGDATKTLLLQVHYYL
jgi:hypothetical protein